MKLFGLILFTAILGIAQPANLPQRNRVQKPSDNMTITLPEQDITVTIHVSSEIATALEKRRRDTFHAVVDEITGVTSYVPNSSTLADQLFQDMAPYFKQLFTDYPPPSVKPAIEAAKKAEKDAEDARAKAAAVVKKK